MDPNGPHVAVLTPWYPETQVPFRGSFVHNMVEAVAPGCSRIDVWHLDLWTVIRSPERLRRVWAAQRLLLPRSVPLLPAAAGAVLRRVPILQPLIEDWNLRADLFAEWLSVVLDGEPLAAPIVHAHVPFTAGWAALRNRRPGAKVFATEHASFLAGILAQSAARDRYDEILDRLDGYFVVGEPLRDLVAATFPHHEGKIRFISNPIDFRSGGARAPGVLRRWLAVCALTERKRIGYLLNAFAICRAEDPGLTLTVVGDGKERGGLEALAADLGVADAVDFRGVALPEAIPGIMAEHDLLVHASRHETFGMVVVEAVAAGLPLLVSRCGGPEHALAGAAPDAGEYFDVDEDPDLLVRAYRVLRARHPHGLDPARARAAVEARFGYEAVALQHHRAWAGPAAIGEGLR